MFLDSFLPGRKTTKQNKEAHWISLLKSISWRLVGTIDTITIAYFVTGKVHLALSIGFVEVFTKIALFYLHERIWVFAKGHLVSAKNKELREPVVSADLARSAE